MNNFLPILHVFEAGESQRFLAPGCVGCSVVEAVDPIDIEFIDENYQSVGRAVGAEVGMSGSPSVSAPFHWLEVTSATAQTVKLFVYGGSFAVSKLAGNVTVSGTVETRPDTTTSVDKLAFFCCVGIGAESGKYSAAQMFNPSGSGKLLLITSGLFEAGSSGFHLLLNQVSLANVDANVSTNKNPAGGSGVAVLREEHEDDRQTVGIVVDTGEAAVTIDFPAPIVVPAGYGFTIESTATATGVSMLLQYVEVDA